MIKFLVTKGLTQPEAFNEMKDVLNDSVLSFTTLNSRVLKVAGIAKDVDVLDERIYILSE